MVINQITITPERQAKYDFSEPYTVSGIQIIKLKDKPGLDKPEDLSGKKVGVGLEPITSNGADQRAKGRHPHLATTIPPSIRTCAPAASTRC